MRVSVITTVAVTALLSLAGIAVRGQESPRAPAQTFEPRSASLDSEHEYLGSKKCKMCHSVWYKSWKQSAKGGSFALLKPDVAARRKKQVGLDSKKDYTTEPGCLKCHTVGYGKPGGYQIPAAGDERAERAAATREGVGCEACHGPGGGFTQVMGDIYLKERPYQQKEVRRAGLRIIKPGSCLDCHDSSAPCIAEASPSLKIDEAFLRSGHGFHQHFPLKYRRP